MFGRLTVRATIGWLAWLGFVALACAQTPRVSQAPGESPAAQLVHARRVLVIAHRGDSQVAPENTLPAFSSAVAAGSDLVELDYLHSADGVPVVLHDDTLDRCSDAREIFGGTDIPVAAKTLAELRRLDAGRWFDLRFAGTKLPTLEEALDTIQAGSTTLIERKAGDAKTCVDLLRRKGLLDRVVVQSFDWEFLAACHRLAPKLVLGALGGKEIDEAKFDQIKATGARAIGWNEKSLDQDTIKAIHDHGYRAWAWTVDDPARAEQLLGAGIDGIISNVPAKVKVLLAQRAIGAPKE